METDTDSLYIAFVRETIDECVKPELQKEWDAEKWNFFSSEDEETMVNFQGYIISKKTTKNAHQENSKKNSMESG